MSNNMRIYERYAQPPASALKPFSNGKFSGTDINPMWRIAALTEAFGPCGIGWYTEIVRMWREDTQDGAATVYCHMHLYIKEDGEWSKPITGVGGNTLTRMTRSGSSTTDEAYKMAYTDAMGIACKALGIGANIWWNEARTKYTANDNQSEADQVAGKTTVTKSDKVPFSVSALVKAIMDKYGVDKAGFASMRQTLITGGMIEDKPSSEMNEADWLRLAEAIDECFGDAA